MSNWWMGGLITAAAVLSAGCSNKAAMQQSNRDADRVAMQVEDLTAQRNTLKEELDRVRQRAGQMQKDLTIAQTQLEQDKATLARANSDLSTARREQAAAQAQLAAAQAQLAEAQAKLQSHAAPVQAEERKLSSPTTQPNQNK